MRVGSVFLCVIGLLFISMASYSQGRRVTFCGSSRNDVYALLGEAGFAVHIYRSPSDAIGDAPAGTGVFIVADAYPAHKTSIGGKSLALAAAKGLRLYIEYPGSLPGLPLADTVVSKPLARCVITSRLFGDSLGPMSLLGINDCHVIPAAVSSPLMVLAKVAGFNRAVYGIGDVKTYPLLFTHDNEMVATTMLSDFGRGRYRPERRWEEVWSYIIGWVTRQDDITFHAWPHTVAPSYTERQRLPADAVKNAVSRGVRWYFNGRFFVDSSWAPMWRKYQGDGTAPFGPPVSRSLPCGDGSMGILEGDASKIHYDGSQEYRYWVRADVQGEAAYALAAAGAFLHRKDYDTTATRLADFLFSHSDLRSGAKDDPESPVFGLIGWAVTHPGVFYGDDNARCILGLIGAEAYMKTGRWDRQIAEAILGNFRTTGVEGFRGNRLEQDEILKHGWRYYHQRDIINPHPHFESWLWACYLWLYDKTGYKPLLTRTEKAIDITMEDYPLKWKWTNGIQQERARMILPLAWLVRLENTPRHRAWLDQMVGDLLRNQMPCGAIREELGSGSSPYGPVKSNRAYGTKESSLIFQNGDPVADMLYTNNFAFFSLNEAAQATGNEKYRAAVKKLADFLVRIQVKSNRHEELDGAWFRAFDYRLWDYWASNSDSGWGAWSTLTGWIQSWIITTQILVKNDQSYWQLTRGSGIGDVSGPTIRTMLEAE